MQFGPLGMGGFGGRFDENLAAKVEQVVGNQTREQRLAAQLREMGVDPDSLPLKPADAKRHVYDFMARFGGFQDANVNTVEYVEFVGSSLGFTRVIVHGEGWDYNDYDEDKGEYRRASEDRTVTSQDLTEDDGTSWRDLERSWEALREEHGYRFQVWGQYSNIGIKPISTKFHESPKRLRAGQVARIEKDDEHQYARMGGIWGDDMLTNLRTMQPITDTTGWVVVEVIEE